MTEKTDRFYQPYGPFRADQLRSGDGYELYRGHPIECAPTGGDGARGIATGIVVLDTDPDVEEAAIDAGFSPEPDTLWAPDIAVGGIPNKPGWIKGVPPLAVEYAGSHQDEDTLKAKIAGLLDRGTRYVWVVRLIGLKRVEVHTPDAPPQTKFAGDELRAEGVLRNPVPVEALYDRNKSLELALSNLLQRQGYNSIEDIRQEGKLEGKLEGFELGIEKGIEQGIEQGIEKGIEQGIDKGTEVFRQAVIRTAESKCGLLSPGVRKTLDTARPDQLEVILLGLATAPDAESATRFLENESERLRGSAEIRK